MNMQISDIIMHMIGIDLIDIRRIEKIYNKYQQQFLQHIFTPYEQKLIQEKHHDINFIAKRWAGKEAGIKALDKKISWLDIEITNSQTGAPIMRILHPAYSNIKIHLSLTDEYPYAQAICFLQS